MSFLVGLMPFRWYAIGAVVVGLLAWGGYEEAKNSVLSREVAELKAAWSNEKRERAEEHAAAEKAAREFAEKVAKEREEARNARIHEEMVNNHRIADLQRERSQLLGFIKAYAAGPEPADDSLAAARARADTLGKLLDEAVQTAAELASDAERESADARELRSSWPQ